MEILEQLARDEGIRLKPYVDTVGKITIGVGFNLTDVGLSEEEVNLILQHRVTSLNLQLLQFQWYAVLDEVRQGAIQNMAYNMGIGGLLHFPSMIHYLTIQDYGNAAAQMLASVWKSQVGDRAVRLAEQIRSGVWQ